MCPMASFTAQLWYRQSFTEEGHRLTKVVSIAHRIGPGSCVTVGVFTSVEGAKRYVERIDSAPDHGWIAPRPGRQYWSAESGEYEYRIESQVLRTSSALLSIEDVAVASYGKPHVTESQATAR